MQLELSVRAQWVCALCAEPGGHLCGRATGKCNGGSVVVLGVGVESSP